MKSKPADSKIKIPQLTYKPAVDAEIFKLLHKYVEGRYQCYQEKLAGVPTTTTDPILATYRFTNVRREHDPTTRHIIDLQHSNISDSTYNKFCNTVAFRMFSRITTYPKWIDFTEDPIKLPPPPKGIKLFTSSYYTSGLKQGLIGAFKNHDYYPNVFKMVHGSFTPSDVLEIWDSTPEEFCKALQAMPGIGPFNAYQIWVDFTYMLEFPYSENCFVIAGPGCIKGLKRLFPRSKGRDPEAHLFWLTRNYNKLQRRYCPDSPSISSIFNDLRPHDRRMNVMCAENLMCELFKYLKIREGEGKAKLKYKGETEYAKTRNAD